MIGRRALLAGFPALLIASGRAAAARLDYERFGGKIALVEARSRGRLGVALADGNGRHLAGYRTTERFPMCSTFKPLAAAALLHRVDAGRDWLGRQVQFTKADLVPYSPVTEAQADGPGMTLAALCEAAITLSDNTAGNLLLQAIGGPQALTAFMRTLDDSVTRLDRYEPDLNSAIAGDPRDTTAPGAMAATYAKIADGTLLSPSSRTQWLNWLIASRTGGNRLRAGLPAGWRIGDKTGSGANGTANHVALIWPSPATMIVAAVYLTGCPLDDAARDAVIADVGRAIAEAYMLATVTP